MRSAQAAVAVGGAGLRAAAAAGRAAGQAGQPVTGCPFPADTPEAVLWVRNHVAAAPGLPAAP